MSGMGQRHPPEETPPKRPPSGNRSNSASGSVPLWRQVALPTEHGGWSLTIEPAVLGLIVAWSLSGLALGVAALVAFVARTPLKVVLVDRWRNRWLERSGLALKVAVAELAILAALAVTAVAASANGWFWIPLAMALPLILVELWFDMRSRSRRLIPELAGAIGMGSVTAAIVVTGAMSWSLAFGLWVVIAARAGAAVVYARTQVFRAHGRPIATWHSDLAQLVAAASVAVTWALGALPVVPVVVMAAVAGFNVAAVRGSVKPAKVIGFQQLAFGVLVVLSTAVAVVVWR